jgi:nicotinamide-nucleotide adenylyltransferase
LKGKIAMILRGMIHGRFQPFHNGHFDYLQQAFDQVNELIIGITNPDPTMIAEVTSDIHRHLPDANPFSYYQRAEMIRRSILLEPRIRDRIGNILIVPFPINRPELWKYYLPMQDTVQFMRILDSWDEQKCEMFRREGFRVEILEAKRVTSGTEIRAEMTNHESAWQNKVPRGTQDVLDNLIHQS